MSGQAHGVMRGSIPDTNGYNDTVQLLDGVTSRGYEYSFGTAGV